MFTLLYYDMNLTFKLETFGKDICFNLQCEIGSAVEVVFVIKTKLSILCSDLLVWLFRLLLIWQSQIIISIISFIINKYLMGKKKLSIPLYIFWRASLDSGEIPQD